MAAGHVEAEDAEELLVSWLLWSSLSSNLAFHDASHFSLIFFPFRHHFPLLFLFYFLTRSTSAAGCSASALPAASSTSWPLTNPPSKSSPSSPATAATASDANGATSDSTSSRTSPVSRGPASPRASSQSWPPLSKRLATNSSICTSTSSRRARASTRSTLATRPTTISTPIPCSDVSSSHSPAAAKPASSSQASRVFR